MDNTIHGDNPSCPECGHYNAMLYDHAKAKEWFVARGEEWDPNTLILTCRDCGHQEEAKEPTEFEQEIEKLEAMSEDAQAEFVAELIGTAPGFRWDEVILALLARIRELKDS